MPLKPGPISTTFSGLWSFDWEEVSIRHSIVSVSGTGNSADSLDCDLIPQLTLVPVSTAVQVSWPTNASGFTLQSATTLANGGDWQDSSLISTIVGDQNVVSAGTTGSAGFFRLHKP